jgi:predicted DNA-binding transcriptional regulator AlpA
MTSATTHATHAVPAATKPARSASATTRLTLKEVAERMNMCPRSIQKLVAKRAFPRGVHLGRDVFWLETVVDQWLEAKFSDQLSWAPRGRGASAKSKLTAQS